MEVVYQWEKFEGGVGRIVRLGSEQYESHKHIFIPDFHPDGPKVFIHREFNTADPKNWMISTIERNNHQTIVTLFDRVTPESMGVHYHKNRKNLNRNLPKRFRLLLVNFGHQSTTAPYLKGGNQRNDFCPHRVMHGEMHKQRLCIFWRDAGKGMYQVIPLTAKKQKLENKAGKKDAKKPREIPYRIPIHLENVEGLSTEYKTEEKKPFALLNQIQTVSWQRCFPVKAADGSQDADNVIEISKRDQRLLSEKMSKFFTDPLAENQKDKEIKLLHDFVTGLISEAGMEKTLGQVLEGGPKHFFD